MRPARELNHRRAAAPPPVDNETLKGDINGKAQVLSRFLGDASLQGKIETSRTEIFSRYKDANERSNAYFEYQVCLLLMNDRNMTTSEKIDKLRSIHSQFEKPIPVVEAHRIGGMSVASETPRQGGVAVGPPARACVSALNGYAIKPGSGHLVEVGAINGSPVLGKTEESEDQFCQWFQVRSADSHLRAYLSMAAEVTQIRAAR